MHKWCWLCFVSDYKPNSQPKGKCRTTISEHELIVNKCFVCLVCFVVYANMFCCSLIHTVQSEVG